MSGGVNMFANLKILENVFPSAKKKQNAMFV